MIMECCSLIDKRREHWFTSVSQQRCPITLTKDLFIVYFNSCTMSSLTAQIDGDRPTHQRVWCPRKSNIFRLTLALFLLVAIAFVVAGHEELKSLFMQYLRYFEAHTFAGSVTFVFVSAFSAVLLLPGSLLTFGTPPIHQSVVDSLSIYHFCSTFIFPL